jgi:hypothetical protein
MLLGRPDGPRQPLTGGDDSFCHRKTTLVSLREQVPPAAAAQERLSTPGGNPPALELLRPDPDLVRGVVGDHSRNGSAVKTKGTTEFPLLSPWLVPSPRYFAKLTQLDRVRLVQVRQRHASRRSGDHRGRSRVVEADHAVFDRAEVTHAALVEYRGRTTHFVGLAGN